MICMRYDCDNEHENKCGWCDGCHQDKPAITLDDYN